MVKGRSISAGRSAIKLLPAPLRHLVETEAARLKGRDWYFAFSAAEDFRRVLQAPPEDGKEDEEIDETVDMDEMEEEETLYRMMVGALIEKLGGPDKTCSDAHQAALYLRSARQDHQKASAFYEKKAGGPRAVQAEMNAYSEAHEDEIRESAGSYSVRGAKYEGQGAQSMEEVLEFWTAETSANFATGEPPGQFAVGLGADGSGMLFKSVGFEGSTEKKAFDELVNQQCTEQELNRQVRVDAAWMAPPAAESDPGDGPEGRDEIILVKVIEGEKMIANILRIDWSAPDGQPRLGPAERIDEDGGG